MRQQDHRHLRAIGKIEEKETNEGAIISFTQHGTPDKIFHVHLDAYDLWRVFKFTLFAIKRAVRKLRELADRQEDNVSTTYNADGEK